MNKLPWMIGFIFLSACTGHQEQEVVAWMEKTRQEAKPIVTPLKEPKAFVPVSYDVINLLDPFDAAKLQAALAKMSPSAAHGIAPNLDRRKEVLEAYPLDTLKMVGTLYKGQNRYALIAADKSVYQAKVGNYVGQNFGLITKVNDDSIEIKEIYLDSNGDWAERAQRLELQEAKQ